MLLAVVVSCCSSRTTCERCAAAKSHMAAHVSSRTLHLAKGEPRLAQAAMVHTTAQFFLADQRCLRLPPALLFNEASYPRSLSEA